MTEVTVEREWRGVTELSAARTDELRIVYNGVCESIPLASVRFFVESGDAWVNFQGREKPSTYLEFRTPLTCRLLRYPVTVERQLHCRERPEEIVWSRW